VTFKPVATFTGTAKTIGYQVSDSSTQIAPSTITVTVGPPPNGPKALDDARITQVNVPVTLDPTVNDIPGSLPLVPNTVLLCLPSQAVGMCTATSVKKSTGTFKVDKKTGLVTFTPKSGWTGVTKVPYIVRDSYGALAAAIITVTIKPAAYLELKELAWTGAKPALKSHPAVKVPDSSLGNGKTVATMRIPKLGSNWQQTVLNGISQKNLSTGLGYYPGTALPGALGNFAVAGHRITRGHPFLNLDRLVTGDSIAVQVGNKIYLYKVTSTKVVEPTSVSVIFPVPGNLKGIASGAILTLTTCTPKNSAEKRLIVHAALDSILDAATAPNKFKSKA
nr:class E sortase [Actinomycetota bacterium]